MCRSVNILYACSGSGLGLIQIIRHHKHFVIISLKRIFQHYSAFIQVKADTVKFPWLFFDSSILQRYYRTTSFNSNHKLSSSKHQNHVCIWLLVAWHLHSKPIKSHMYNTENQYICYYCCCIKHWQRCWMVNFTKSLNLPMEVELIRLNFLCSGCCHETCYHKSGKYGYSVP